jgi:hypothetical protein
MGFDKEARDRGFEDHAMDQVLRIARETTFEQRVRWLEQTIDLLRPQRFRLEAVHKITNDKNSSA